MSEPSQGPDLTLPPPPPGGSARDGDPAAPPAWGAASGRPPPPGAPPAERPTWGVAGTPSPWGAPPVAPPAWDAPPAEQPTWGASPGTTPAWGPPPADGPSRRRAPIWVVVVVGLSAFVAGLGIGGMLGFAGGAASNFLEGFAPVDVGPDAAEGAGPIGEETYTVGPFTVEQLLYRADFAGDFEARLTVTNDGPEPFDGGAMEVVFLGGGGMLGRVTGEVPPLMPGQSVVVDLWGFDPYDDGVQAVELRIG